MTTELRAAGAGLAAAALLALSSPALAAGTGGLDITPLLPSSDGRAPTAFHTTLPESGTVTVPFALRNLSKGPRTGRVYAADVTKTNGNYAVGAADTSPWVQLANREVTLKAAQVERLSFRVRRGSHDLPTHTTYAAIVLEVRTGSVVTRAATLVYLEPKRGLGLPTGPTVLAVVVLVAAAGAVVLGRRRLRTG